MKYLKAEGDWKVEMREKKRRFVLVYMAGFLAGILYANLISGDYILNAGILDDFFLEGYIKTDIDMSGYLWYVAYTRLIPVVILAAAGSTKFKKGAVIGFLLWTGFSCGIILAAAVMKMGIKGILLCLLSLFPQCLCYVTAYVMLLWFLYFYPKVRWNISKTICFLLFLLTGIMLECYVNPVVMKIFLQTL